MTYTSTFSQCKCDYGNNFQLNTHSPAQRDAFQVSGTMRYIIWQPQFLPKSVIMYALNQSYSLWPVSPLQVQQLIARIELGLTSQQMVYGVAPLRESILTWGCSIPMPLLTRKWASKPVIWETRVYSAGKIYTVAVLGVFNLNYQVPIKRAES